MRRFDPVWLPEDKVPRGAVSVTFGRAYNVCPRAAFLYQSFKGGAQNGDMERGSALHRVFELSQKEAVLHGEVMAPPEVVKAILAEVLADPSYRVPLEQHDYMRECAFRWASEVTVDPGTMIACETMFVLQVGGWTFRAKIDRADLIEGGAAVDVKDWKSSRSMPAFEDIGRKRKDGTIAAKDYQLVLYALCIAFGVPVRVEDHLGERVEIPEPFGVADRAQRFDLAYVFPGIEGSDGLMGSRPVSLTRLELLEYMESLRAQVAQIENSIATGDWPASYGSHCGECTARALCPIPGQLRDLAGVVNTREEAEEAAEQLAAEGQIHRARRRELVKWVKAQPLEERALFYGRDQVIEVGYVEATEIVDREGMFRAMQETADYGVPFDRSKFERVKKSTPIKDRTLTEAELEERRINNGGTG